MALLRVPLFGRQVVVRRFPYYRREELDGAVPSREIGKFRVTWYPRGFSPKRRRPGAEPDGSGIALGERPASGPASRTSVW